MGVHETRILTTLATLCPACTRAGVVSAGCGCGGGGWPWSDTRRSRFQGAWHRVPCVLHVVQAAVLAVVVGGLMQARRSRRGGVGAAACMDSLLQLHQVALLVPSAATSSPLLLLAMVSRSTNPKETASEPIVSGIALNLIAEASLHSFRIPFPYSVQEAFTGFECHSRTLITWTLVVELPFPRHQQQPTNSHQTGCCQPLPACQHTTPGDILATGWASAMLHYGCRHSYMLL